MSANRREFIRRMVVASGLLAAGALSAWELFEKVAQGSGGVGGTGGGSPPTLPTPAFPAGSATSVTSVQTVTVTEYASGSATEQSSKSSQTSQTAQTTSSSSSSSTQTVPPGYILVTPLSALAGKTSAYFNHPTRGLSMLVDFSGQWRAFSATCTHAPCTVQYNGGASIVCPCHGGTYNPSDGAVTGGPPPAPLPEMSVLILNSDLYVSG